MRKLLLLTLLSLFIIPHVISDSVNLFSPDSAILIYAGEQNTIDIPIKNTGEKEDTIFISVWPTDWVNLKRYWVKLQPNETKTVSLIVEPPENSKEGVTFFTITSNSLDSGDSVSSPLYLNVKRKTDIFLSEIKLNKQLLVPGESLAIQPVITNLDKYNTLEVLVTTDIYRDGQLVQKMEDQILLEPESSKTITHFFEINNNHEKGEYSTKTTLRDKLNKFIDEKEVIFSVDEVIKINKDETTEWGIFYYRKTIEVENQGNVKKFNFTLTDSIPRFMALFFYPESEPTYSEQKEKRVIYSWVMKEIDPNQKVEVSYTLNFFTLFVSLALMVFLAFVTIKYLKRPLMVKRHRGILTSGKEVSISIHVKNRSRKPIKNIVVKDFIPAVVKLVRSFDTLKPEIKPKQGGLDLIWKIKRIKPREELIITYKIKPSIEVIGELKLPKAKMVHEKSKGKKGMSISKSIVIKGKIK